MALSLSIAAVALAPRPGSAAQGLAPDDTIVLSPADAELTGLDLVATGLVLGAEPLRHPALIENADSGIALWRAIAVPAGMGVLTLRARSEGAIELDVRASRDAAAWSGWANATESEPMALHGDRFVQVRAVLGRRDGSEPRLDDLWLEFSAALDGEVSAAGAPENPTVRLWATREGMVGGRTANGHVIGERDRFVALPSRRALSRNGGNEYQVRLKYNGREATAPVWDVGPWNTKDNYWDPPSERELFKDLPRFLPQAFAAWQDGHNGGRDQYGRWVSFPASMDIADGTFLDDLGMKVADWVDATFLWVNAPSPAPLPSYPRVVPKAPPATVGEQRAASVEPPAGQRWYFAEGSTKSPFQTWLLLQNPWSEPAQVTLSFMLTDGSTRTQSVQVRPTSRQSIFVNQVLPNVEFSTRIDSDRPIFPERAMYFRRDGHATTGAQRPEKRWCAADGLTRDDADTWLLVQNPGSAPAHANVAFLLEGGGSGRQALDLPPTSRLSLYTNAVAPNTSFSACLDSDQPVIVERATYLAGGGGSGGMAASVSALAWYFAEGNTRPGMSTRVAIGNPGSEAAQVELTYLVEDGDARKRSVSVPPMGKLTVDPANDVQGTRFGIVLSASTPVVADRTMAFGPGGMGTHSSAGVAQLSKVWYLPEGSTAAPFDEFVLVANPGGSPANVVADFMREDGSAVSRSFPLKPGGRLTIDANAEVPNAAISTRIRSDQPVVAERSMYWDGMAGGTNAVGIPWDR